RRGGAGRRSAAGCGRGPGRSASGLRPGRWWAWTGIVARAVVHVQRSLAVWRSGILMPVDPRFLRTFAAVVRLEAFSAPARELAYTQSAVSQHIAALEADLGVELLTRRPVAPTEAGVRLLEHGGAILLRLDAARADVMRVAAGPPTRLAVGATPLSAGV